MQRSLLLMLFLIIGARALHAQQPFWQSTKGPYGGEFLFMTADQENGYVYASSWGQGDGVFRLGRAENEWRWMHNGLPRGEYRLASGRHGTIFASKMTDLYRSTDHGEIWTKLTIHPGQVYVHDIKVSRDETLYAATSVGIFRSEDNGDSWSRLDNIYVGKLVRALMIDSSGAIYATSDTISSVLRSIDNGLHWDRVHDRFTSAYGPYLLTTPKGTVLAGDLRGIWRFTYADSTWRRQSPRIEDGGITLLSLAPNGDILASFEDVTVKRGMWRSTDDGISWQPAGDSVPYALSSVMVGDKLFFGLPNGIARSSDNGYTWDTVNTFLAAQPVSAIVVTHDGTILTNGYRSVHRSTDDGATWTGSYDPIWRSGVHGLSLAADGSVVALVGSRLIRTTNSGVSWFSVTGAQAIPTIHVLAANADGEIMAGTDSGLYRSIDYGSTWAVMNWLMGKVVSVAFGPSSRIYAVTPDAVYRSTDGAATWQKIHAEKSLEGIVVTSYGRVVVGGDKTDASFMPIYVSDDWGDTWHTIPLVNTYRRAFALDADENVLVGSYDNEDGAMFGPYGLRRGDTTWISLGTGLDQKSSDAIALSPRGYLVVGSQFGGVYKSARGSVSEAPERKSTASLSLTISPNPFSEATRLSYTMPNSGPVTLEIVDLLGRHIRTLVNEWRDAGDHAVDLDAAGLPAGSYRCIMTSSGKRAVAPIVLVR